VRPMLAVKTDGKGLRYPLLISPKLDGIRCLIIDGVAMSRNFKPIPNQHTQRLFGRHEYDGLDGELIVGDPRAKDCYNKTDRGVMTRSGEPDVKFYAFDTFELPTRIFIDRLAQARERILNITRQRQLLTVVPHTLVYDDKELCKFESSCVAAGYEGIMLRDPAGPYKFGRSTLRQGWLLKLKRFLDSEAVILGVYPQLKNHNPATEDALGRTVRAKRQDLMVPMKAVGGFHVEDVHGKFNLGFDLGSGSGFTKKTRAALWKRRAKLVGLTIKYTYQPTGVKDKPRFPEFVGFRSDL
jgi:DNA ligase-1